ncbi:type II secretion system F family protein [Actinosynnema sp. NPDC023587]|uniref:type II secretion system F family protein n=1 Tax=Actinosynnema sp. NPDC023587 TaxID=3154695 RepID=UPI0033E9BC8A
MILFLLAAALAVLPPRRSLLARLTTEPPAGSPSTGPQPIEPKPAGPQPAGGQPAGPRPAGGQRIGQWAARLAVRTRPMVGRLVVELAARTRSGVGRGGLPGGERSGGARSGSGTARSGFVAKRVPRAKSPPSDPFALAATWDLLAAALRAGLPVATAVRAVVAGAPAGPGSCLRKVGDLLALGADPATAWTAALDHPDTAPLARAARRSARSGAALAGAVTDLAAELRARADDQAEARAQRAAVLVAGPLALCFLPAFLCLGVLPVVVGLAGRVSANW